MKLERVFKRILSTLFFIVLNLLGRKTAIFRFGIGDVIKYFEQGNFQANITYYGKDHLKLIGSIFGVEIRKLPFNTLPYIRPIKKIIENNPTHPHDLNLRSIHQYSGKKNFNDFWSQFSSLIASKKHIKLEEKWEQFVFLDAQSTYSLKFEEIEPFIDSSMKTVIITNQDLSTAPYTIVSPNKSILSLLMRQRPKVVSVRSGIVDLALLLNCEVFCIFANKEDYLAFNLDNELGINQVVLIKEG